MPETTIHQIALLPEAFPIVKQFIEMTWPTFDLIELPDAAVSDEERDAGIRTYFMAMKKK
jgi:hypothetical protein